MQTFVKFRGGRSHNCRPGELVHQALKVSGRLWDHYRTAALLFGVSILLLLNFGALGHWSPQSTVLNVAIAVALLIPVAFGVLKLWQLARYRLKLSRLLALHEEMARRMVEVLIRGNRVYPSIRVHSEMLDNVVLGSGGIYAVQLFVPPPGAESVRLRAGRADFSAVRYSYQSQSL